MIVYLIVSEDRYGDDIIRAFDDKGAAKAYRDGYQKCLDPRGERRPGDIKIRVFDTAAPSPAPGEWYYTVILQDDGLVDAYSSLEPAFSAPDYGTTMLGEKLSKGVSLAVEARNKEHAIKIAKERLSQMKARGE